MKKIIIIIPILFFVLVLTGLIFDWGRRDVDAPGIENINVATSSTENTAKELPISVKNIKDGQTISSPLFIEGSARGYWYFEASFPVELVDLEGNILGNTIAYAQSDWMTTEYVDFIAYMEFTKPAHSNKALLVLNKDNPSGNPDMDQAIFIPVILK